MQFYRELNPQGTGSLTRSPKNLVYWAEARRTQFSRGLEPLGQKAPDRERVLRSTWGIYDELSYSRNLNPGAQGS